VHGIWGLDGEKEGAVNSSFAWVGSFVIGCRAGSQHSTAQCELGARRMGSGGGCFLFLYGLDKQVRAGVVDFLRYDSLKKTFSSFTIGIKEEALLPGGSVLLHMSSYISLLSVLLGRWVIRWLSFSLLGALLYHILCV